jgi:hypothetical protein
MNQLHLNYCSEKLGSAHKGHLFGIGPILPCLFSFSLIFDVFSVQTGHFRVARVNSLITYCLSRLLKQILVLNLVSTEVKIQILTLQMNSRERGRCSFTVALERPAHFEALIVKHKTKSLFDHPRGFILRKARIRIEP